VAADAGEDHYVAGVLSAEEGEGSLDEVDLAEEDYFELVADEVLGCGTGGEFFDCTYDGYLLISIVL
jgi:hypothetical protein